MAESAGVLLVDLTHYNESEITELLHLDMFSRLGQYQYLRPDMTSVSGIYMAEHTDLVKAAEHIKVFVPTSTDLLIVLVEYYVLDLIGDGFMFPDTFDVSSLASLAPVVRVCALARSRDEDSRLEIREDILCSSLL